MENVCKGNPNACPCQKPDCPNHGKCCACVAYHKAQDQIPFCLKETAAKMFAK